MLLLLLLLLALVLLHTQSLAQPAESTIFFVMNKHTAINSKGAAGHGEPSNVGSFASSTNNKLKPL
jgi:hypothetical protein